MTSKRLMRYATRLALGLAALAFAATPSFAQDYYLCASDGTVTMPDSTVVPIWGFADIGPTGACTTGLATLPGPVLTVPEGPLTINVSNALSDPVSIFIPGLSKASGDSLAPQVGSDAQGRERLTSFDRTVLSGASSNFIWTATEGTYLYHSGADVRTQVPMGLYGALVVTGTGYPAVDQELVLVFSEIDPALNADPANFKGARVSNWNPKYFLINGAAYDPVNPPISITTSETVLLRFVNAGLQTFVPTLGGGLYMDVIAEDGNLYPYPAKQYGIELTAGKTMDGVINAGSDGTYAIYDRSLHLANGGLLANMVAGAAVGAPTAVGDSYTVAEDTVGGLVVADTGVLANDLDSGGLPISGATATLVADVSAGTLTLNTLGGFTYIPNTDFSGNDQFSYVANDGGADSNVAVATITVTPVNDAPVANADFYDAPEGGTINIAAPGVLANDTDADGDDLTAIPIAPGPPGAITFNANGSFDYTPAGTQGAIETFQYVANDGTVDSAAPATVTITVTAPADNIPPFANDDFAETQRNTLVVIDVAANDVDPDGDIVPATVVVTTGGFTQRGGTVVNNGDGTVTYEPKRGFRGTDTFQYTVDDNDDATSNVATVRVNVVK